MQEQLVVIFLFRHEDALDDVVAKTRQVVGATVPETREGIRQVSLRALRKMRAFLEAQGHTAASLGL